MEDRKKEKYERDLSPKQENFCHAYVRLGNKSAAYKEVYSTDNMKDATVGKKASIMSRIPKIRARIMEIQAEFNDRHRMTVDEIVMDLSEMVRFDPGDMFDDEGRILPIRKMPKPVRQMIMSLEVQELFVGKRGSKMNIGEVKKVKLIDKLGAIEKLMKHFGAYERDNSQKVPKIVYENVSKQFPEGEES